MAVERPPGHHCRWAVLAAITPAFLDRANVFASGTAARIRVLAGSSRRNPSATRTHMPMPASHTVLRVSMAAVNLHDVGRLAVGRRRARCAEYGHRHG